MKRKLLIVAGIVLALAGASVAIYYYHTYFYDDPKYNLPASTNSGGETYDNQNGCAQSKSGGIHPDYCKAQQ